MSRDDIPGDAAENSHSPRERALAVRDRFAEHVPEIDLDLGTVEEQIRRLMDDYKVPGEQATRTAARAAADRHGLDDAAIGVESEACSCPEERRSRPPSWEPEPLPPGTYTTAEREVVVPSVPEAVLRGAADSDADSDSGGGADALDGRDDPTFQ